MTRYLAIDWSGSLAGSAARTWIAAVEDGRLVELTGGLTRTQVVDNLLDRGGPLVVGLDFGFSFPSWYVERLGCRSAPDLWALVEAQGERWLAACERPLWGRPGRPRGPEEQLRRTEREVGSRPKSVFQVGGAGSVGTGSIRGMPALARLRAGGFAIWPFDPPGPAIALEIYPRLLTGAGPKSRQGWRAAYLDDLGWPEPALRPLAAASEDAFDAAVSAYRMWQHAAELSTLPRPRDDTDRLEGRIWEPLAGPSAGG